MSVEKIYLSLGSNIGDRKTNIETALLCLNRELKTPYSALSSIIESKSWGFFGGDFVNCVVLYELEIDPEQLLAVCKKIETQMGREEKLEFDAEGKRIYHDRIIDIDILLIGDKTVDLPHLKVPHPLMKEREFIMTPLMEIFA